MNYKRALAGEERVVWVQVGDGQLSEVRCKPGISIDNLKERIKEEYKPKLDQWARADLTLKFMGRVLEPYETIDAISDEKDISGKPTPVTVATS